MPPPAVSPADEGADATVEVPLVETTSVTLMLLDVEAVGRDGAPMRGLRKKDFTVRLEGKIWPIYSVDDSCACVGTGSGADPAVVAESTKGPSPVPPGRIGPVLSPPGEFVIYIDFSQLQLDGRARVRNEVTRWLRETMRPQDQVMIEGYSSVAGLREIRAFTSDRASLLAALERAYVDRGFIDEYADLFESRVEECRGYPPICPHYAMEEFDHGRRSLRALRTFLDRLESRPGRRELLYFQQNGAMVPGTFYRRDAPTQLANLEEVAASAASSHTSIYPINAAPLPARTGLDS